MWVVVWLVFLASLLISYGGAMARPTLGDAGQHQAPQKSLIHELGAMAPRAVPVELGTEPVTVQIVLNKDAGAEIKAAIAPTSSTGLILTVGGIEFEKIPEIHYQLYANLPATEKSNYNSIYFIGNLTFFDLRPHKASVERPPSVAFDIKRTVQELESRKLWNDRELSVTFVMKWLEDRAGRQLPVPPGIRARFSILTVSSVKSESLPVVVGAIAQRN